MNVTHKAPRPAMMFPPHVRIVREPGRVGAQLRIAEPRDAAQMVAALIGNEEVEVLLVLHLNTRSKVIAHTEVTRGLVDSSLVHPREVFRCAIAAGASGIIVAHNHPSGDPTPSAEDRAVTRQLVAAGQLLDIPVHDHIIVGADGRFTSLAELGFM